MKTRSGKVLNTNYTSRKRKHDQNQPERSEEKADIASKINWAVLPPLVIQRILFHLKSKEMDKCFIKLENQMSLNQHWRKAVQVQEHRTHLTWNPIKKKEELNDFLNGFGGNVLKNLQQLNLHNTTSNISDPMEPFQLEPFGNCENLQSFTLKRIQLTQNQFSMFFGLKSLTKLVLQIPLRPVTAEQPFAGFPTENHCLNIEGLTSLTHLDVECTQTPTQENYFTENWKALENGKPWIKYGHLSPNIQFLRLKFTDIWISCIEDSGRRDLMAVNDEFQSQYMKKLKYLSLEAFTVLQSSAILKNLVSQAPLDYVHVDDSVSGNYGITESVWIPQLQVSVRIKSLQSLRWPRGVVGRATARIRGIRRR